MSSVGTENEKNKLMEILEEELSVLKLRESTIEDVDVHKNDKPQNGETFENIDKQEISKLSNNAGEILQSMTDKQTEMECKANGKDRSNTNVTWVKMLRQKNCQDEERERITKEKTVILSNASADNKYLNIKDKSEKHLQEEPFIPPSDSTAEKIMRRAEFYFQDYNIFKNSYLLNLIKRNKKGYVSLKVVSSLQKIRPLTKDCRVVAYSLMKSDILELNEENNKVRRKEPIPKIEDTSFGKTIMVFNLPQEILSCDNLKELFSKFGTVVSSGMFEMNSPESDPYHKRCLFFHRKIATKIYGIVEFDKYDEVLNALKDEESNLSKENGIIVVPLMPQIFKKERRYLKFVEEYNPYPRRRYGKFKFRNRSQVSKNEAPYGSGGSGEVMRNGKKNVGGYQYNGGSDEILRKDMNNIGSYQYNGGSGEVMRNEKMNINYQYKRGTFRRGFRGRKYFLYPNNKNYSNGQVANNCTGRKWEENRQLKSNNSINVERIYPNVHQKKSGYTYIENGVQV